MQNKDELAQGGHRLNRLVQWKQRDTKDTHDTVADSHSDGGQEVNLEQERELVISE